MKDIKENVLKLIYAEIESDIDGYNKMSTEYGEQNNNLGKFVCHYAAEAISKLHERIKEISDTKPQEQ